MKHTHKYKKINKARRGNPPYYVMQCILPGCNSYTPMDTKLSGPSLIGKIALCNKCDKPFELTRRAIRQTNPVCDDCVESRENIEVKKAEEFFQKLEGEIK